MWDLIRALSDGRYAPHGYCLLWQPGLVWTHVVSDLLIAAAYFSIPIALISFIRRRRDVHFGWMVWLFALFILACGTSHLMQVWNLWHGDYALEGLVKAITAFASVPTAILLWRLIPQALALPSPRQLALANAELEGLVDERDAALARLTTEIAQRERAEEALVQARKIDAIGRLTGGIAHDFNNLLQAITGNLDLIQQRPGDQARVARWAENALKAVDRGTRLTGQLLAFSRTQRLELKPLSVDPMIVGMLDLVRRSIGPAIELHTRLEAGGCRVQADQTQLELALLNLAINARDAMPEGGRLIIATREVSIVDHQELEPGRYVEVAVADTGHGMTEEVRERALDPFFTTKGVGRGTGLGLSMAFGVARQSGGTLLLSSAPGAGTTVTVLLRCVEGESTQPEAAKAVEVAAPPPSPGADVPVMVIDDDDQVRDAITDGLRAIGYTVLPFASGAAALRARADRRPALTVVDFAMPGLNGADIARQIRAEEPGARIVFVSGFADSAAIDQFAGPHTRVLRKPFQSGDLARVVAEMLADQAE
ncbi:MAG: response regulator [Sphingomonas sp.]|uniref:ATP-binding protein n=1 Tax=Sphingomonas sp. TaxID=28214 RepID=UPI0025D070D2|nr:ATP-binding protein [Sphingomonas sp.]MBX9882850.1 response regulator [Sphingomonas sp.]